MRYNLKKIIPGIVLCALLLSMMPVGAPVAHAAEPASTNITCSSLDTCILLLVYWAGPGIAGGVAYIGAYFFSIVVQLSLNSTAYALNFLSTGWETVRDIANMAFIFILIYIALTVMLAAETSGTIKTLAVVVVIALLVNFSFFFTRVVIDAGNIVAVQFYNAIPLETNSPTGGLVSGTQTKDLSLSIMGAINPQELLNSQMLNRARAMAQGDWGGMAVLSVIYISVAAIFWILFFVFLQVGIKFMMRIVGLWFVLIASPLAFVARTMPKTKHFFDQWLDYLIKFSFYPAIFLFMFWVLTKFTTSILLSGGNGTLMGALYTAPTTAAAEVSTMAVIATVMIRMGFVVAVLYVGLKVSDWIVKEGSAVASKMTGWSTGKALGTVGFAGRNSFGWAAHSLGQTKFMQNVGSKGVVGRNLLGGVNRIGRASFDGRNSKLVNKGLGVMGGSMSTDGKISVLDMGKSTNKNGYKDNFDARVKALQKESEQFKAPSKEEKAKASIDAKAEFEKTHGVERAQIKSQIETKTQAHKPFADRLVQLQKELSAEQNDAQRSNITQLLDAHIKAAQPTLDALKDAQVKKAEFDKKEIEQVAALAAKLAPNYKEQFAKLITSNEGNLLRTLSLWVPKANTAAAEKIRKGKSESEKLLEHLKELQEKDGGVKESDTKDEKKKDDSH